MNLHKKGFELKQKTNSFPTSGPGAPMGPISPEAPVSPGGPAVPGGPGLPSLPAGPCTAIGKFEFQFVFLALGPMSTYAVI